MAQQGYTAAALPAETGPAGGQALHPASSPGAAEKPHPAVIPADQLVERFEKELTALGGQVFHCHSIEDLADQVLELLQGNGIAALMSWEASELPAGLAQALQARGLQLRTEADPQLRAGITGVVAAAADTGTLALAAGPGRLQSASLLPELHLAVLQSGDILPSLADVLQLETIRQASTAVFISGPSRTADIEMTLTIGVHGPRQVYVFCLSPA
jgi:L-lactate dehydrogenase complex protein LldG